MPNDINDVKLTGTIGKELEIKYGQSGTAYVSFSIAVNSYKKDKDGGQPTKETVWVVIKVFGKTAEMLSENATKGTPVFVSGKLKEEKWEANDGEKKSMWCVIANTVEVIMRPRKGESIDTYRGNTDRKGSYDPPTEVSGTDPF